ncbi:thioesterase domain-containing protein [Amycolatopsis sp. EV170708-02-1]|uniref:thioesterase domain-containing protein n=1 Tax=Amycolatopsis sp. EV170708-02-1 TaxID=2919322 RepID=UPI001F0BC2AF|nr:thioesterase domain-containing protein [Amycolatopsis sp. EV170708-02-1]UMP06723.1 thioesterase domain-containing protein [Amycolatopsis sp. EV170708-02-1]
MEVEAQRVCVLGANTAGLVTASELEAAGHTVIVLEGGSSVGDRGTFWPWRFGLQSSRVAQLAARLSLSTQDAGPLSVVKFDDGSAGAFQSRTRVMRQRYYPVREFEFPRVAEPGLAHSASALATPVPEWLSDNELEELADTVGTEFIAAGYGCLDERSSALHFVKFLEVNGLLSSLAPVSVGAGFTIAGGTDALCDRITAELECVRCNVEVERIARLGERITIQTTTNTIEVDKLVVALPLDEFVPLLDAPTAEERRLASSVRYTEYVEVVCAITGWPYPDLAVIRYETPSPGRCVLVSTDGGQHDSFSCYLYSGPAVDDEQVIATLRDDVRRLGARLDGVQALRRGRHMPHFPVEGINSGAYQRLDALQGKQNTYHTGSLPGFAALECQIAHAQDLVQRSFRVANQAAGDVADDLCEWLVEQVAALLGTQEKDIDPSAPVADFGLHSLAVMELSVALRRRLGTYVPHTVLLQHETIEDLAQALSGHEYTELRSPSLVPLSEPGEAGTECQPPFFWVGAGVGYVDYLRGLVDRVAWQGPSYGLLPPGLDGLGVPLDRIEEIAEHHVAEIRSVQPNGPYFLAGHSAGGVVVYEMARQLTDQGEQVNVIMLDPFLELPDSYLGQLTMTDAEMAQLIADGRHHGRDKASAAGAIDPSLSGIAARRWLAGQLVESGWTPADEVIQALFRLLSAHVHACRAYWPARLDVPALLLKAEQLHPRILPGQLAGWESPSVANLDVRVVPGDHYSIVYEPGRTEIAHAMHEYLGARVAPTVSAHS